MVIRTLNDDIVEMIKSSKLRGLTAAYNEVQYAIGTFLGVLPQDIQTWGYQKAYGDPAVKYSLLDDKRENIIYQTKSKPLVRIWDKNHNFISQINADFELSYEEIDRDTGEANLTLLRNDWIGDFLITETPFRHDLNITIDPYPNNRSWRWRWGGKIMSIDVQREEDGIEKIQVKAVSNREHVKHILYASTPICPPEFQPIRTFIFPGPCRSVITTATFYNLARLFSPLVSIIQAGLNPAEWFSNGLMNLNPLNWPIQVNLINPFTDTSRWTVIGSRWQDMHSVTASVLQDAGCTCRVYTWLTEDVDSPNDEFNLETALLDPIDIMISKAQYMTRGRYTRKQIDDFKERVKGKGFGGTVIEDGDGIPLGVKTIQGDIYIDTSIGATKAVVNSLFRPWRNCFVISIEDHSGVEGVTGTIIDGLIRLVADTLDDVITETIFPLDTDNDARTDPFFAKIMSVMPEVSPVTWRDGTRYSGGQADGELVLSGENPRNPVVSVANPKKWINSGVTTSHRIIYKRQAKHIMVGGHSPGWVNESITFGIRYGLSQLSQIIYAGPNGFGAIASLQAILSSGLENLYQGQFDDMLLAWQRYTNPVTDQWTGSHGFQEHFETGNGTAWTLAGALTLRQGWYKTRSYEIFKVNTQNGYPYTVYQDFNLSDRMNFEIFGILYTDQCTAIKHVVTADEPMTIEMSIGNDDRDTDPLGQAVAMAATISDVLSVVIGGNESF